MRNIHLGVAIFATLVGGAQNIEAINEAVDESVAGSSWIPRHEDIPAWVITLERTPMRYKLFTTASYAFQVFPKLQKFSAVDGQTINLWQDERIAVNGRVNIINGERKSHSGLATRGMAGLYVSHVDAWRAFLATDAPMGIIFEDDALVQKDSGKDMDEVLASMPDPAEWDLWLLGVVQVLEDRPPSRMFGPGWIRVTNWFGTQAYLLTRRGAERMLAHAYPMTAQIDAYMAHMASLGEVVAIYRSDKKVDFPQFGVIAGTTVQQSYCHTCDMLPSWDRERDEAGWRRLGNAFGAGAAFVPWGIVYASCVAALFAARTKCVRLGCTGRCGKISRDADMAAATGKDEE